MIFDGGFAATGDEDHLLDPGLARFINRILDQGAINHREHFLGQCLGRWQKPRAEPANREHCFAHSFHKRPLQRYWLWSAISKFNAVP
jgi:hypothetical protein